MISLPKTYPFLAIWAALAVGCLRSSPNEVVVYTALDREFSEPIFDDFTRQTGIRVLAKYDTESTKTVGLANAIIAEAARPRCDVFWNNEILNTLRLERRQLLASYVPRHADAIPANYRSPDGYWHGFAARARVLIVNRNLVDDSEFPRSIYQLVNPTWRDSAAIAKPLFGTTATHVAMFAAHESVETAEDFWTATLENAQVLSGNRQVARAVAGGHAAWGLTDTDDAVGETDQGHPVAVVFPDQDTDASGSGGFGTPLIPNTVSIIQGCPNRASAEKLVDFLVSPETEARLARGRSAQIPLLKSTQAKSRLPMPATLKTFDVDFDRAEEAWDQMAEFLQQQYLDN